MPNLAIPLHNVHTHELISMLFLCVTGDLDSSMVETVVGIISGLILLLGMVGLIIWMRRSGRSLSSAFPFHTSAFPFLRSNWGSVPAHIVAQSNPATEGVKVSTLHLYPCISLHIFGLQTSVSRFS